MSGRLLPPAINLGGPKSKKKLNRSEKKERLAGDLQLFLQKYGRKAQKAVEPNDRKYSRAIERKIRKHMKPGAFDALLRDDED